MIKFLLACLAIACTLLIFGLFGLAIWGVILACIVFFSQIGLMIWFCCKVIWLSAESIFEALCEKFIK